MNKEKYLKELEKRLQYLKDEEKQQEIFRVSNELDSGKVMNDLSIEVNEIYSKYNINIDKIEKKESKKNKSNKYLSKFIEYCKKNSLKQNAIVVRDIIILLLIVSLLKIPFIAVDTSLFSVFGNSISDKLYTIIHYIIEILYIIFAISLFTKMFKKRFDKELKVK
ncbi:MAG: hypothetical protein E7158_01670 [Firmicutes bacterium]|nr:hypothetical protein [Bacillota bacterium]